MAINRLYYSMIKNLLTTGNPKIAKGLKQGYLTNILHLAPANLSGYNLCPSATAGCKAACLNTAGRGGIMKKGATTNAIQIARIRKSVWFMEQREAFMAQLIKEIRLAIKSAEKHGLTPVFRLNGTSDIRWESIRFEGLTVFEHFPTIQFYDYTKHSNRKNIPTNYHLTFSLAENNESAAIDAIHNGMNVAAVFAKVPTHYTVDAGLRSWHLPVINGDESDLRFLDIPGVIVGLKAKGKAKQDITGFVR
jgi:hypothetical protein